MKKSKKILSLFCVICLLLGMFPAMQIQAADNQEITVTASASESKIYDDDAVTMDLSVTGKKLTGVVVPSDVVLVMDCSGSMTTEGKFTQMQNAAKTFIDLLDLTQHRVGLVRYSDGVSSFDISDDATALKNWVGSMSIGGATNTDKGIQQAEKMLNQQKRTNAKSTIVLLSDGEATNQAAAKTAANVAKDPNGSNITIFTVALLNNSVASDTEKAKNSGANQSMIQIATSEAHHHYVGAQNVVGVYEEIAGQIGEANIGAVTITQEIAPEFELVPGSADQSIPQPTISGNTMTWEINDLREQTVDLQYQLRAKKGTPSGTYKHISSGEITYLTHDGLTKKLEVPVQQISVYHTPVITSVTPSDFKVEGGENVVVKGTGFESNSIVKLGNSQIRTATVVDANTITFTAPAGSQGSYDFTVQNPGGKTAKSTVRYIAQPTITSISPNNGSFDGGTKLTVLGTNFMKGAKVTFDGVEGQVGSTYAGKLYVVTPPAQKEGTVDVVLTNPDGSSASVPDGFTYDAKVPEPTMTLTGITPASSVEGEEQKATLTGTLMKNITTVQVGGVDTTLGSMYDSKVYVYIPGTLSPGTYDVVATDNAGNVQTLPAAYTVTEKPVAPPEPAFTLTGVSPANSIECHTQQITISGTNLSNTSKVSLGGTEISVVSVGKKSIVASVPGTIAAGTYDIAVTDNQGNTETLANAYTVTPKPTEAAFTLTAFTPGNSVEEANTKCTLTGTDLKNVVKVQIGGVDAKLGSHYDAKVYVFVPTTLTTGTYDVVAFDMYGNTKSLAGACEVTQKPVEPPFTIKSISPASNMEGTETAVTISGSKLANIETVKIGGVEFAVKSASATKVTAVVPGTIAPGQHDVVLKDTAGNEETLSAGYTVTERPKEAAFTLSGITPATSKEGESQKCTITGTSMKKVVKVQIGGEDATLGSKYDAKMYIHVPTTLGAGTYDVVAFDQYGNTKSLANAYTVTAKPIEPLFTLTGITPTTSEEGVSQKCTVTGTSMGKVTSVKIGGQEAKFGSRYDAKVYIYTPDTLGPGRYDVVCTGKDGSQQTLQGAYTVTAKPVEPSFTLTSFTSATGKAGVSQKCTLKGSKITNVTSVQIGGVTARLGSKYEAKVYVYTPASLSAGTYDVVAYDKDGNAVTLKDAYTVQ